MENEIAARKILNALENCKVPITWSCIDEPELIDVIAKELRRPEREKLDEKEEN